MDYGLPRIVAFATGAPQPQGFRVKPKFSLFAEMAVSPRRWPAWVALCTGLGQQGTSVARPEFANGSPTCGMALLN